MGPSARLLVVALTLSVPLSVMDCTSTTLPPYGGLPGDFVDGSTSGEASGDDAADVAPSDATDAGDGATDVGNADGADVGQDAASE
jgi:hypothetical protein